MQPAQQALDAVVNARDRAKAEELLNAAKHCVENAAVINDLLIKYTPKTSFRLFDESKVYKFIEEQAAKLAAQRIQLNVSMQNEMRAHIDHLTTQNVELQQTNISLQSTLLEEEKKYHRLLEARLEELSKADLEEELRKIDSFPYDVMNRDVFATPKKDEGGAPMPKGKVIGDGNLFGTSQELQHNKLKY